MCVAHYIAKIYSCREREERKQTQIQHATMHVQYITGLRFESLVLCNLLHTVPGTTVLVSIQTLQDDVAYI